MRLNVVAGVFLIVLQLCGGNGRRHNRSNQRLHLDMSRLYERVRRFKYLSEVIARYPKLRVGVHDFI